MIAAIIIGVLGAWAILATIIALMLGAAIRLGDGHPRPSVGADTTEADDAVDPGA